MVGASISAGSLDAAAQSVGVRACGWIVVQLVGLSVLVLSVLMEIPLDCSSGHVT